MSALEILLYGIATLITINNIAVLVAVWLAFKSGQTDEYRRQYWRAMLEKAQKEVSKDEQVKNNP